MRLNEIFTLLVLFFFSSCQQNNNAGILECLLDNIDVNTNGHDIIVGQGNGWTDSTAIVSIIYHSKSIHYSIESSLKGNYKGCDVYIFQSNLDSLDEREYPLIPNNMKLVNFSKPERDDIITPPYDPDNVQVEYNFKRNCIGDILRGKGFFKYDISSNCFCKEEEE